MLVLEGFDPRGQHVRGENGMNGDLEPSTSREESVIQALEGVAVVSSVGDLGGDARDVDLTSELLEARLEEGLSGVAKLEPPAEESPSSGVGCSARIGSWIDRRAADAEAAR